MKLLIAIPTYNCSGQIRRVLEGLSPSLLRRVSNVLIIDNQSLDDTVAVAIQTSSDLSLDNIQILKNPKNLGLGGSHKVAFDFAVDQSFDYVAILHGDNQANSDDLHTLLDIAERYPQISAVFGSRFASSSKRMGYSWIRTVGNLMLNCIYSILTLNLISDLGSGLNLFRVQDLKCRDYLTFSDQFNFNNDLLLAYCSKRLSFQFVPIRWTESDQISNAKTFVVGWTALIKVIRWKLFG